MGKKLPITPRSKLRSALRSAWLRSRERQAALKRDRYTCQRCGVKQSRARGREVFVNVHHLKPIDWDELLQLIYDSGLMVGPEGLITLCVACHEREENERERNPGPSAATGNAESQTRDLWDETAAQTRTLFG